MLEKIKFWISTFNEAIRDVASRMFPSERIKSTIAFIRVAFWVFALVLLVLPGIFLAIILFGIMYDIYKAAHREHPIDLHEDV